MAERIIIPLYGPSGLQYPESEARLIVNHLGVHVVEPTDLIPARPERPTPEESTQPEPSWVVLPPPPPPPPPPREDGEAFAEIGEAFYFQGVDLRNLQPTVIELEAVHFSPIKHQGLIYVIEAASFLPAETLDIVQEQAEKRDITAVPIYVRGIT